MYESKNAMTLICCCDTTTERWRKSKEKILTEKNNEKGRVRRGGSVRGVLKDEDAERGGKMERKTALPAEC
jgi:hypothetical protein